jgi:hypothetical protein
VGRSDVTVGLVPKTFNSDFYVVCATVIPVLFLAVAVQGNAYKAVLDAAMKAARTNANDGWLRQMSALARSRTLQIIGYFIWSAGAIGEILALQVLYQDHESPGSRITVFLATIVLVVAAAAGPLRAYTEVRSNIRKQRGIPAEDLKEGQPVLPHETALSSIDNMTKKSSGLGWPEP